MYNNFVNFLCPWRSVDTVGIRGDEDGGRNLPAGMGMEEEMSPKQGMWQGVVKYPPLNPRPVDILSDYVVCTLPSREPLDQAIFIYIGELQLGAI
ncbi:hypothetical protein QL285_071062 [Trifolium repens]|nr:hypothetical protein QL285_071062 [Trifolium repens]